MKIRVVLGLVVVVGVLTAPGVEAKPKPKPKVYQLSGTVTDLGCAPTAYSPSTGRFRCIGRALLDGSWNGAVDVHANARSSVGTGDVSGTVLDVFDGDAAGHEGTLILRGSFAIDGRTGTQTVKLVIAMGTGAFAGATGKVVFTLYNPLSAGPAQGGYTGSWTHPAYA